MRLPARDPLEDSAETTNNKRTTTVSGKSKLGYRIPSKIECLYSQFQALPCMASLESFHIIAFPGLDDGDGKESIIIGLQLRVVRPFLNCSKYCGLQKC